MALVKTTAASLILANVSSKSFTGKNDLDLSNAIASGLVTYALATPNLISFILSGTVGPVGQVISISVAPIVPAAMAALMNTKALSLGLKGKNILQLFQAISTGVAIHFQTAQVSGTTAGLAVGAGTGKFLNIIEQNVYNLIRLNLLGKTFTGKNRDHLARAIAFGFTAHMKQSPTVTVTVAGAIAPVAPAGPLAITGMPTVFNKLV
jgi:hypothetical protein